MSGLGLLHAVDRRRANLNDVQLIDFFFGFRRPTCVTLI